MPSKRYKEIEPFHQSYLKVSELHTLYYELCGNPDGFPVVFVHGGPGCSFSKEDRRFFDPNFYKVILYHQRGVGNSTPSLELKENTIQDLVEDIERLRLHLNLNKLLLFGISWGTTLSLAYTIKYSNNVAGLILNGIFLGSKEEIDWSLQSGASNFFPEYWQQFIDPIPQAERSDLISAYYSRIHGSDSEAKERCLTSWSSWESATFNFKLNLNGISRAQTNLKPNSHILIESHYFINYCFLSKDYILDNVDCVNRFHIPITIVQGRYDLVSPLKFAWALKCKLTKLNLVVVDKAGHSTRDKGISYKLVDACNTFRDNYLSGLNQ